MANVVNIKGNEKWNTFPEGIKPFSNSLGIFPNEAETSFPPYYLGFRYVWTTILTSSAALGACFVVTDDKNPPHVKIRFTPIIQSEFLSSVNMEIIRDWGCRRPVNGKWWKTLSHFFISNWHALTFILKAPYSTQQTGKYFYLFCFAMFLYTFIQPVKISLFILQTICLSLGIVFDNLTRTFGKLIYTCCDTIARRFREDRVESIFEKDDFQWNHAAKKSWYYFSEIVVTILVVLEIIIILPFWLINYCLKVTHYGIMMLCVNLPNFLDALLAVGTYAIFWNKDKFNHSCNVLYTTFKNICVESIALLLIYLTGGTTSIFFTSGKAGFLLLKSAMIASGIPAQVSAAIAGVTGFCIWQLVSQNLSFLWQKFKCCCKPKNPPATQYRGPISPIVLNRNIDESQIVSNLYTGDSPTHIRTQLSFHSPSTPRINIDQETGGRRFFLKSSEQSQNIRFQSTRSSWWSPPTQPRVTPTEGASQASVPLTEQAELDSCHNSVVFPL